MPTQSTTKKLTILKRRQQVAKLSLQGWTQLAIAEELSVSQPTISTDLKALQQEWLELASQDVELARAKMWAELEMVKREACKAWERSQQPAETYVVSGQSENRQMRRTRKQQHGDPRFLELVRKTIDQQAELLGLNRPASSDEDQQDAELDREARQKRLTHLIVSLHDRKEAAGKPSAAGRSGRAGPDDQQPPWGAGAAPAAAEPRPSPGAG